MLKQVLCILSLFILSVSIANSQNKKSNEVKLLSDTIPIKVDYAQRDYDLEGSAPTFNWSLRTNHTWQNQGDYQLNRAIVIFDTLVATDFTTYEFHKLISYTLDTAFFNVGHINTSGQENKLVFYVLDLDSNHYPDIGTDSVLWSDTLVTDTTMFDSTNWEQMHTYALTPNLKLNNKQRIGLVFEFYGEDGDTAGITAQYLNDGSCAIFNFYQEKSKESYYWPNSFAYRGEQGQQLPDINGVDVFHDCNASTTYEYLDDGESFIQDIKFCAQFELEPCTLGANFDITPCLWPDNLWIVEITPTNGIPPYTYQWNTTFGNFNTDSVQGEGGDLNIIVSDSTGCQFDTSFYLYYCYSIDEYTNSLEVDVYPNPAQEKVVIGNLQKNGSYIISLIDVYGKEVEVVSIDKVKNSIYDLDIGVHEAGVYILKVQSDGKKAVKKIIKR